VPPPVYTQLTVFLDEHSFGTHTQEGGVVPIVPEIIAEGYEPLGEWKDVFGFHCYVVSLI
jgi:hypothetical protein